MHQSNILINDEMLKLGDFGLSRICDGSKSTLASTKGTYEYMCPELFGNEKVKADILAKIDIWLVTHLI